jgi:hypothetical protein
MDFWIIIETSGFPEEMYTPSGNAVYERNHVGATVTAQARLLEILL